MSDAPDTKGTAWLTAWFLIVGVGFLALAAISWVGHDGSEPEPLYAAGAEQRRENLRELRQRHEEILNQYGWEDEAKGFVRLPIERAMELMLQEWQDPEAGRAELIERVEQRIAQSEGEAEEEQEIDPNRFQ